MGRTAERTRQRWANANHHSTVADAPCLTLLLLLTLFVGGRLVADGTIVGQDSATQFYPWYSYLGERLHSFQIPEWNPAQFGGAPFAADPQSGWTYLPAMVLFTLFPLALATNAFLLVHLALAGFATYGLARTLGLRPLGALVAAVAYEFSGLVANRSVCCPAQIQVAAWMPLLLLGAEIALRRTDWPARARWWGVAGLALSQILASWLGQVGYYALLVLGSYVAYRTLLAPVAEPRRSLRGRVWLLVLNGCAIFAFGFGLAAAGLLPRLAYNVHSNVAGGIYANGQSYAAVVGGWPEGAAEIAELGRSFYYPGGAVLVLGLAAIVLARERGATPYFLSLAACALVLSSHNQTLLHWVLYRLLPQFQALHEHRPERVAIVAFLAPAMLAGATVDALPSALHSRRRLRVAAALPLLGIVVAAAVLWRPGVPIPWLALVPAIAAIVVMLASVGIRRASVRRPLPAVLLVIVGLDLVLAGPRIMAAAPYGGFHRVDVEDYYRASGAVRFLQEREAEEPFRFFGYNPDASATDGGWEILYRDQFADPATAALIVNNRATVFRLQDVQGYNPVQLERFVDYMTALNGHPQEYHDANVYPEGLESPLLDLLNVRYVVVPANSQRDDIRRLVTSHPVVYRDAEVQIVERPEALPRAWIVHAAAQMAPDDALPLLASGAVDPRETALLEATPPGLERPSDHSQDAVHVDAYAPESIRVTATTSATGLLVLSEVAYPDWEVFVDGQPAGAYVVDHLFRGVVLPPGTHVVEWRYRSRTTMLGIALTLSTIAGVCALSLAPLLSRRSCRRTARPGRGRQP